MRILHVNTADQPGGAELVACSLVKGQRATDEPAAPGEEDARHALSRRAGAARTR